MADAKMSKIECMKKYCSPAVSQLYMSILAEIKCTDKANAAIEAGAEVGAALITDRGMVRAGSWKDLPFDCEWICQCEDLHQVAPQLLMRAIGIFLVSLNFGLRKYKGDLYMDTSVS
jgi:hypothetical protein